LSNRLITLNTITANGNSGYGAYIDNCGYNSGSCTSTITPAPGVTLTGSNDFENNKQEGLWLTTKGAITVNNLASMSNTQTGAYLDNHWGTGASVTLTGYSSFFGNNDGLNSGTEDGLDIYSDGAITINNLQAGWNDGTGANLDNCLWDAGLGKCTGSGNIMLTGTTVFTNNKNNGLYADAFGTLTLNNITADNNGGMGVKGFAGQSILVACGSMTKNGGYGWWFAAGTTATLKGVFAYGNNGGAGNTYPVSGSFIYTRTCP